jgi:ABC-type phosphate/phosphonate transport system substrate-binding protein
MQSTHGQPLYREIIAPRVTPYGALTAVIDGLAEVAPVDSWAFALMQRHTPELTAQVRIVARTDPTPIPLLVASPGREELLDRAFLTAHEDPGLQPVMEELLIERFVRPEAGSYTTLKQALQSSRNFWRRHPLAETTDPAFALD